MKATGLSLESTETWPGSGSRSANSPVTFGRGLRTTTSSSPIPRFSRGHAELRQEADGFVITDRGSANGTRVNGVIITPTQRLRPSDEIEIAHHRFMFEAIDAGAVTVAANAKRVTEAAKTASGGARCGSRSAAAVLLGLAFALILADLVAPGWRSGSTTACWKRDGRNVVWKGIEEGNVRRMAGGNHPEPPVPQGMPQEMRDYLVHPGQFYREMWPSGPDQVNNVGPRNIRIAYIGATGCSSTANSKRGQIELIPEPFDAESAAGETVKQHVLAICEGSRSRTFSHYKSKFGAADFSLYGLDGEQLSEHGPRPCG